MCARAGLAGGISRRIQTESYVPPVVERKYRRRPDLAEFFGHARWLSATDPTAHGLPHGQEAGGHDHTEEPQRVHEVTTETCPTTMRHTSVFLGRDIGGSMRSSSSCIVVVVQPRARFLSWTLFGYPPKKKQGTNKKP